MKTVEIAGAQLKVVDIGEARKGTIFLLHGGRGIGDHASELAAYRALADDYRVIAFDQRGCGESSLTPPYTFERLADDLEELREKLVGGPVIVQGGSFGGMIALLYATRHPKNLTHLILRGTTPSYEQTHFTEADKRGRLRLIVSPDRTDGSIGIQQDARLYAGLFDGDERATLTLSAGRMAYVHLVRGALTVNGVALLAGDAAKLRDIASVELGSGREAEVLVFDLPAATH